MPLDIEKKFFPWVQGNGLLDNGSVYAPIPADVLRDTSEWLGVPKENIPKRVGWRLRPIGIRSYSLSSSTKKMVLEYELELRTAKEEQ